MNNLIAFIPALPLIGFIVLSMAGRHLPKQAIAWIGAGTVSIAAILAIVLGFQFLQAAPPGNAYTDTLWQWINTKNFSCSISFRMDVVSYRV